MSEYNTNKIGYPMVQSITGYILEKCRHRPSCVTQEMKEIIDLVGENNITDECSFPDGGHMIEVCNAIWIVEDTGLDKCIYYSVIDEDGYLYKYYQCFDELIGDVKKFLESEMAII